MVGFERPVIREVSSLARLGLDLELARVQPREREHEWTHQAAVASLASKRPERAASLEQDR